MGIFVNKCDIYQGKSEMTYIGYRTGHMCDQTEAAAHWCSSKYVF